MSGWTKTRALLATARIANVPSVVSNVFTGVMLGLFWSPGAFLWASMAGVFFYLGGNFLNDWHDRDWDRERRPERALPRGFFGASTYLVIALGLFCMGAVCAWALGTNALLVCGLILSGILAYTWWHKRTGFAVVWVAACRALLLVLGMVWMGDGLAHRVLFPMGWLFVLFSTLPLFSYIVALSLVARFEARGNVSATALVGSAVLLLMPVLLVGFFWQPICNLIWVLPGLIPYLLWMVVCFTRRGSISRYVSGLLAGIPLVDGMLLMPIMVSSLALRSEWQPLIAMVFPVAFVLGLLLQKVAPAS